MNLLDDDMEDTPSPTMLARKDAVFQKTSRMVRN